MDPETVIDDIDDMVNRIAGVLNSQYGELAGHVVTLLDDKRLWQGEGVWTMERWLAWKVGVAPSTASSLVAIARRAGDLPVCFDAFQRGALSLDQMTAIARKAPWWTDQQTCQLSSMMTVSQIRRLLGKYPFPELDEDGREVRIDSPPADEDATPNDGDAPGDPAPPDATLGAVSRTTPTQPSNDEWCSMQFGDDGVFRFHAQTDFETGHIIQAAFDEARDRLIKNDQDDVTWVDAFREVAQTSLDSIPDPARSSRFKVSMFVNADRNDEHNDGMVDASGWNVPDAIRRFITCDGLVTPVFVEDGMPVSVGRSQRIVPDRTRRIIEHRDHGRCQVPGCTARLHLDVHHIIHWEHDGPTDTWNLVLICGHHHRLHHKGRLGIAGNADDPDGLMFTNEHGQPIRRSGASPKPPSGPPPPAAAPYQPPLGQRLDGGWVYFRPPPAHMEELAARANSPQAYLRSLQRADR